MNRLLGLAAVIALVAPVASYGQTPPPKEPATQAHVDVTGTWDFSVDTPHGTMTSMTTFKQEGEKLTGTQTSPMGEVTLEGTVKDSDISFVMTVDIQGDSLTITFTGKVEGDSMSGNVEFGTYGSSTWSAKRGK